MKEQIDIWREAEEMVNSFKENFRNKFSVELEISYKLKPICEAQLVSIIDVYNDINITLWKDFPAGYVKTPGKKVPIDKGISSPTRARDVVIYRHLFYYFAHYFGFSKVKISTYIKGVPDHSVVIHGIKTINNALDTKNPEIVRAYKLVKDLLESKYGKLKDR